MLHKREIPAEEEAPSRIQGKGVNQMNKLLAPQAFGRDAERSGALKLFQAKLPREGLSAG